MKSVKYLEDLQAKLGSPTQQQLAQTLGITQGAVAHYLNARRVMDDETCLAVAMALNIDPLLVVGAACIDRAEKTGQSSLWEAFMSRTAATAASVLLVTGVNLFLTAPDVNAETMRPTTEMTADNINYAKLWANSSNAPFCNLYNRKCDFSPWRAPWCRDFFAMVSRNPFALRYAGQLQAGMQDSLRLLPHAALRARLPVQCLRFCVRDLACHAAALVCAVPGRRSGASVWRLVWPRNFGRDLPRLPCAGVFGWRRGQTVHADNFDGPGQAWHGGHGALTAQRNVCGSSNRVPDGLRHAGAWTESSPGSPPPSSTLPTIHCKSIRVCVPGLARVRLPALSLCRACLDFVDDFHN